jgi:Rrf2 family protein
MLLDLAEHENEGFISLKDVAERQGISKNYLEQIITLLKNTDMLKTARGFQGGYKLAKSPTQYRVGDILRITEGNLVPVACLVDEVNQCARSSYCMTVGMWHGLGQVIEDYLDGITLQDILDQHRQNGGGGQYSI